MGGQVGKRGCALCNCPGGQQAWKNDVMMDKMYHKTWTKKEESLWEAVLCALCNCPGGKLCFFGDKMSKDDISITEQEISQRTNTAKGTTDLRAECFCQSTLPKQARNKLSFWALAKKQRGAKSGKVFVKLLRCWYHENSRICGSNYRPDNISIQFNLIVSPTGET